MFMVQLGEVASGYPSTVKYTLRAPAPVTERLWQLDSLYLVALLNFNVLSLTGEPTSPSTLSGMGPRKLVAFLHVLSGKANKLAYGTSVAHCTGAVELELEDAVPELEDDEPELEQAETVTVLADGVTVVVLTRETVVAAVLVVVSVLVRVKVTVSGSSSVTVMVPVRVTVLGGRVLVVVLVQNSVLLHPVGQRCLGPIVQPGGPMLH